MNSTNNPFPTSESMAGEARGAGGDNASANASTEDSGRDRGTEIVDRMAQSAHRAVDKMAERATPAVERVRSSFEGASARAHSQADHIAEVQDQWLTATRDCIRSHPIASVGVAVLGGMLLSRILSDRH
ncbi:MAG TPA: hypothetical protein PK177_14205 [Burkholderiaceae bacterium]|nr:hypothetical protein [Burkholderiaceae bacterium]